MNLRCWGVLLGGSGGSRSLGGLIGSSQCNRLAKRLNSTNLSRSE